jgi:hypothetical protein
VRIRDWECCQNCSYRIIGTSLFNVLGGEEKMVNCRNPQTTHWAPCQEELKGKLCRFLGHFCTVEDTEVALEFLQQVIDP